MKFFVCTDHDNFYVGGVSIVIAETKLKARNLLSKELVKEGLKPYIEEPFTLQEIDTNVPIALVLQNGDY